MPRKILKTEPVRVILADPTWSYRDNLPGPKRGARKIYRTTTKLHEIMRMPLPPIEDNAWLFLWRVHTHQEEADLVMRAWGFEYCSEVVWVKTKRDSYEPTMGMGRTIRQAHEVCLVGRRGRPIGFARNVKSVIHAPLREHSQKPEEMYELIESFDSGPYCELFARNNRPGWLSVGDELPDG